MIQRFLHEQVEFEMNGFPPTEFVARLSRRPIAMVLEEHNQALYGLMDYFWGINFNENFSARKSADSSKQEYVMLVANLVPKNHGSSNLVSIDHEFIDLLKRKVEAEFGTRVVFPFDLGCGSAGVALMSHAAGI